MALTGAAFLFENQTSSYSQESGPQIKSNAAAPTPMPVPRPTIDPSAENQPSASPSTALPGPLTRSDQSQPSVSAPALEEPQPQAEPSENTSPVKIEQRFGLPPSSRQRLRECTIEWQKMKLDGATNDKTWRDFAQVCLVK